MSTGLGRRLRGAFGVAVTWGVAFATFGTVVGGVIFGTLWAAGILPPAIAHQITVAELVASFLRWGVIGAASGAAFSLAVARQGRGKRISELSRGHFSRWGAGAGALGSAAVCGLTLAAFQMSDRFGKLPLPRGVLVVSVCLLALMGAGLGSALGKLIFGAINRAPQADDAFEPLSV